jgi:hypothetical protein
MQMDQRPYPGPPPLFHIRILSLFTLLSVVDAIMFIVAVESALNYGVGVTVLFANEVRHMQPFVITLTNIHALLVRHLGGYSLECYVQVRSIHLRVAQGVYTRWRQCSTVGGKKSMGLLH